MKPSENTEVPRMSVDAETKEILQRVSEHLSDAMMDFVKCDHLNLALQETEARVAKTVQSSAEAQNQLIESALHGLNMLESHSAALKAQLQDSETGIASAIQGSLENATASTEVLIQRTDSIYDTVTAILVEAGNLSEISQASLARIESLDAHLSFLKQQLEKSNRPWWRKLLG